MYSMDRTPPQDIAPSPRAQTPLAGLRVAYVAFEGLPNRKGSGVRIGQMVRALSEAGAEITLIGLQGKEGTLPKGVKVAQVRLAEQNFLARALAFKEAVARRLYALNPDVIHFRGPFEGEAALSAASRSGARTIFEVNGLPSVELRYHYPAVATATQFERKLRAQEQAVLRQADLVLTQSHATGRFVRLRSERQPMVIPNGANPALFRPPDAALPALPLRLLYAGSISPWQGLMDLFAAVRDRRHRHEIRLTVIGPGRRAWRRALAQSAKRTKADRLLEMVEATDQASLAAQIQQSHICVAPLRRDMRNRIQGCSPIKLFEYMAAGRAVLSTDLPCVREIVEPGRTGLLAKPSNPNRLRDALRELCENDQLREELGRNARKEIERSATWAHRRAQLVCAYRDLLTLSGVPSLMSRG